MVGLEQRPTHDSQVASCSPCMSLKGEIPYFFSLEECGQTLVTKHWYDLIGDSFCTESVSFHSESSYEYETQVLRKVPYWKMFSPHSPHSTRVRGTNAARDELLPPGIFSCSDVTDLAPTSCGFLLQYL